MLKQVYLLCFHIVTPLKNMATQIQKKMNENRWRNPIIFFIKDKRWTKAATNDKNLGLQGLIDMKKSLIHGWFYLTINSLQSKIDGLRKIINFSPIYVTWIEERKLGSSFPDSQVMNRWLSSPTMQKQQG